MGTGKMFKESKNIKNIKVDLHRNRNEKEARAIERMRKECSKGRKEHEGGREEC